jgi:hypothetical protein
MAHIRTDTESRTENHLTSHIADSESAVLSQRKPTRASSPQKLHRTRTSNYSNTNPYDTKAIAVSGAPQTTHTLFLSQSEPRATWADTKHTKTRKQTSKRAKR